MTEGREPPEGWGQQPSPPPDQQPTLPAWGPPAGLPEDWEPTQQQPPPSEGWPPGGQPPSPEQPPKDERSRAERIGYTAGRIIAIPLMILMALGIAWAVGAIIGAITNNDESSKSAATAAPATAAPDTSVYSLPTVATTSPATTVPKVAVPNLVGTKLARARTILDDRGLYWSTRYKTTARYSSRTVISQSPKAGASVRPGSEVTLVIAKAPPPTTAPPPPPPTTQPRNCDPSYPDVCLHQGIGDYDCASGSGNGPNYVEGPITVLPPDPFDLDGNGDGIGCEQG